MRRTPPPPEAVAHYLRTWTFEDGALPVMDPAALFGWTMPVELEVGCGTGEFLCGLAQEHPGRGFIGLDPSTKSLYLCVRRAADLGLANIRFLRAPVSALYPALLPDSLQAVYLHFPDPFIRNKGEHKVLNARFFEAFAGAVVPGGTVSVVSDNDDLFQEGLKLAERAPGWERAHTDRFLMGYSPRVKSRYQIKWERYDVIAKHFAFRRTV